MARFLSKTFSARSAFGPRPLAAASPSLCQPGRARSTLSGKDGLVEVDLSSSSDGESEALMIKKLDDIVNRIIIQRATPDWLPFLPGSSFWLPPRRSPLKFADFVGKLADQLTDEESLALSSDRGWPCAHFFVNRSESGNSREVDSERPVDMEMEMAVEVLTDSEESHPFADEEA